VRQAGIRSSLSYIIRKQPAKWSENENTKTFNTHLRRFNDCGFKVASGEPQPSFIKTGKKGSSQNICMNVFFGQAVLFFITRKSVAKIKVFFVFDRIRFNAKHIFHS
jgi:hypothetical protein